MDWLYHFPERTASRLDVVIRLVIIQTHHWTVAQHRGRLFAFKFVRSHMWVNHVQVPTHSFLCLEIEGWLFTLAEKSSQTENGIHFIFSQSSHFPFLNNKYRLLSPAGMKSYYLLCRHRTYVPVGSWPMLLWCAQGLLFALAGSKTGQPEATHQSAHSLWHWLTLAGCVSALKKSKKW